MSQQTKRQALTTLFAELDNVFLQHNLATQAEINEAKGQAGATLEQQVAVVQKFFLPAYKDGKLGDYVNSEAKTWLLLANRMKAPTPTMAQLKQRILASGELLTSERFLAPITEILKRICLVIVH